MNSKAIEPAFYCGTSNIIVPARSKAFFPEAYQERSRLHYYGSLFNTAEINRTFYKLPMPRTVERWVSEVPDNFRFTFKLSKQITHAKELAYNVSDVERFMRVITIASHKKGCLLVQFPASIKLIFFQRLSQLLDDLTATGMLEGWNLALEFRDSSWYDDRVYEMLERYKATIVMHDMPKSFTPLIDMERSFVYLRFHGPGGDYRGGYSNDFLQEHSSYIKDWLREGLPVFAYFNNTIGEGVHNAITLAGYLDEGS